jgi:tetratricopeptide (TPR) repeat protein
MRLIKILFSPLGAILVGCGIAVLSLLVASAPGWMHGLGALIVVAVLAFFVLGVLPLLLRIWSVLLVAGNHPRVGELLCRSALFLDQICRPNKLEGWEAVRSILVIGGRFDEVKAIDDKRLAIATRAGDHAGAARAAVDLAYGYMRQGDFQRAISNGLQALEVLRRAHERALKETSGSPEFNRLKVRLSCSALWPAMEQVARMYMYWRRYPEAEALLEEMRSFATDNIPQMQTKRNFATLYNYMKDYDRAEGYLREALALAHNMPRPLRDLLIADLDNDLGDIFLHTGRVDEAAPLIERAHALMSKRLKGTDPSGLATFEACLGLLRAKQGNIEEARRYFDSALSRSTEVYGERHPILLGMIEDYIEVLETAGDRAAAEKLRAQAATIRSKYDIPDTMSAEVTA